MRAQLAMGLTGVFVLNALLCGCGGGSGYGGGGGNPPATPTGLTATAGPGQVALTWNSSAGATSYNLGRSTTSGGPYTTIASPAASSYTDMTVASGTVYYYVVSAASANGTSANSSQVSATPTQPVPPPTPTGLAANVTTAQVALTWNSSSGATSYKVGRSTTSGGPYTTIASPPASPYTDLTVTNGTTYYYVVAAVNANGTSANSTQVSATPAVAPTVSTTAAQNGAVIVSLASTTPGSVVHYTVDGSTPTTASQRYEAPFLVASNLAVNAMATAAGHLASTVTSQNFTPNIPSGTLVWSDEFTNTTATILPPDPTVWTYDTGGGGFGNNELETYCAWGSNASPCNSASPNEFVGTDGFLHIVAQQPSPGVYTSARLKTQGLFSFQYGRIEFKAMVPEAQGFWPANWSMGNNIATVNWPSCGEMDVLERVDAATNPDQNFGSVHGPGFTGGNIGAAYNFPSGQTAGSAFHTYDMIWTPGSVQYFVDDPTFTHPYASFTPSSLNGLPGASWPFDNGQANFIILNLAIGGSFPGPPDNTTPFPSTMLIDYVRIYTN